MHAQAAPYLQLSLFLSRTSPLSFLPLPFQHGRHEDHDAGDGPIAPASRHGRLLCTKSALRQASMVVHRKFHRLGGCLPVPLLDRLQSLLDFGDDAPD